MAPDEKIKTVNIKKKRLNRPIYYGVAAETGELVSVADVERGLACGCICPACSTRLEARKGDKKKHHFAHEINRECLYGAELSVYHAFYELLKASMHFFLPDAVLSFHSYKQDEIVKKGSMISLTDVTFQNDPTSYPPVLLCYAGENCFQIILNIENYYSKEDYAAIKTNARENNIPVVAVDLDDLDALSTFSELQQYIDLPDHKSWIFNRVVEEWDRKYRELAVKPAQFENGYLCLAQINQFKNVYSARMVDCISCRYCYDHMADQFCMAHSYIDHVEDFRKPEAERKRLFDIINKITPIKKISEFSCPKCGAPMKRKTGPKGVFAGCSRFPQCRGSRQVEPATEQVILPNHSFYISSKR